MERFAHHLCTVKLRAALLCLRSHAELAGHAACAARADTYISKTRKLYMDTRTQRNIAKLSEDLSEVHQIMTRNIAEVLGQGERLDSALSCPVIQQLTLYDLGALSRGWMCRHWWSERVCWL